MDEEFWKASSGRLSPSSMISRRGVGAPEVAMGGGAALMMRMRDRLTRPQPDE